MRQYIVHLWSYLTEGTRMLLTPPSLTLILRHRLERVWGEVLTTFFTWTHWVAMPSSVSPTLFTSAATECKINTIHHFSDEIEFSENSKWSRKLMRTNLGFYEHAWAFKIWRCCTFNLFSWQRDWSERSNIWNGIWFISKPNKTRHADVKSKQEYVSWKIGEASCFSSTYRKQEFFQVK